MKLVNGTLRLAATDLANHLACGHLTGLDRGAADGRWDPPDWFRPEAAVLQERGLAHERAYLAHLERQGRHITHLAEAADGTSVLDQTLAAMRAGLLEMVRAS